jgi:thiosulfate dehydrogenase [quinone] large subunit
MVGLLPGHFPQFQDISSEGDLIMRNASPPYARGMLEIPPARLLFRSTRTSLIWLIVRLWLGWQWLDAGWQKATGSGYANWLSHSAGLQGFIAAADSSWAHRAQAYGHPEVAYGWYVSLLNDVGRHAQVVSVAVTFSELAVGVGLLLGCLTGIAAAGGVALNLIYITSGSAGPNGVFILLGILLLAAWRVAGYLGADYFILPAAGTPWQPGWLSQRRRRPRPAADQSPDQLEREAVPGANASQ